MHPVPRFEKTIDDLKRKWDGVFNRSILKYEEHEKFWKYFFATEVIPFRDSLFGDWKKAKHNYRYHNDPDFKRRYDCYQMHKEYEAYEESFYQEASSNFWERMLDAFKNNFVNISEQLTLFGFKDAVGLTEDMIQKRFRGLSQIHHPDKGGDNDTYIQIIEAKDDLLRYIRL